MESADLLKKSSSQNKKCVSLSSSTYMLKSMPKTRTTKTETSGTRGKKIKKNNKEK